MQKIDSPTFLPLSSDNMTGLKESKNPLIRRLLVIGGIPVDNLTMAETLDRIDLFIRQGRRDGRTRQIATINVDFIVKATEDPELRYLLQGADLATPDGMPLVWGARMLGVNIHERVAGADMVPAIAERAAKRGYSVYLFGAMEGVADQAGEILKQRFPGLNIVGTASPPMSSVIDMEPKFIEDIKKAKPDILLVALGNPKQEKFIGMHKVDLGVPVAIGIGGTLDFIAGKTSRAPMWMQKSGTEWIYRLLSDPRRLAKRYYNDIIGFSGFFTSQWLHMRSRKSEEVLLPDQQILLVDDRAVINLSGRVDMSNNDNLSALLEQALVETSKIDVSLENVTFMDSVAIGTLLACTRIARDRDGDIRLIKVKPPVMRTLKLLKLDRFFEIFSEDFDSTQKESPTIRRSGQYIVIPTPPVFDAITAKTFLNKTLAEIQPNKELFLDFSETRLLASAGLATIAKINHEITKLNGQLTLVNCS
ncbi:MAG: WecB/TagA/CpsF family glycosyltransferase, partial [Chloroflexota bacterium]